MPLVAVSYLLKSKNTAQIRLFLQGKPMLPVNEIFETIQGEAFYTGSPAVFVRLQGCPIGCPWCDTKQTWDVLPEKAVPIADMLAKEQESQTFASMTEQSIVDKCIQFKSGLIVITGGEPCLYDLTALTTMLGEAGKNVQIETSGTHEVKCSHRHTWVTVSPKVNMPGGFSMNVEALKRANEIKYPVGKDADIQNLKNLLKEHGLQKLVWLQPLSQSKKATEICMQSARENGWRVSIQTHKFIGVR